MGIHQFLELAHRQGFDGGSVAFIPVKIHRHRRHRWETVRIPDSRGLPVEM
jgi:hypothetical protein